MKTSQRKLDLAALLLAGVAATFGPGLAHAQSHSIANWSNPPGTSAASKAATEATPGKNAAAGDRVDGRDAGKQEADARANKGKGAKAPVKVARNKARKSGASTATGSSSSATTSSSATDPVNEDGASKGGANATMQAEPSQATNNKVEQHAFDTAPGHK